MEGHNQNQPNEYNLDAVGVERKKGHYENADGKSPNALYGQYKRWFKANNPSDKEPMSFALWVKWAQEKGLVGKQMAADGPEEVKPESGHVKSAPAAATPTKPNIKRRLAIGIGLSLLIIGTIALAVNSGKE